jgi:hypothetical protein
MMSVEVIEHEGTRFAEIIWADTTVEHTTFFSPAESSFQFGLLSHKAGYVEPSHYHQPFTREISDLQQMFVVQRGKVAVRLFTDGGELLREVMMTAGDAIVLIHGVHAFGWLRTCSASASNRDLFWELTETRFSLPRSK